MQWWRDAKFGIFIHWGPYSVIGRHEWARHRFQIPQADYDGYAKTFNPVRFNADAWVNLAQAAGARYMVITSKHHDGFSIYRSKVSDYDMEITPYKGDPLRLLAAAARRKSLPLGYYHSIMDWHHPDYIPKRAWEVKGDGRSGGDLNRYLEFMKAQVKELLTGYGPVATVWFDGEWEWPKGELKPDEIYDFIRTLSPNTLINDRIYNRAPGSRADYGTPEQFVPATGITGKDGKPVAWESCVTINEESWGYNKYETVFKTDRDLIRMLIEVASKGGNLLLNIGPKPDGTIQEEFVVRLNAMGRWLRVNGESIYGTSPSPFSRLPFFGRATAKGNTVYLHVFQWPANGTLRVPVLKNRVLSARLLARPGSKLTTVREGNDTVIWLRGNAPDEIASVIALTLDGPPQAGSFLISPEPGNIFNLGVESCEISTRFEQRAKKENFRNHVFLTRWTREDDVPTWTIDVPKPGLYKVEITYGASRAAEGTAFIITAGKGRTEGTIANTGNYEVFRTFPVGMIELAAGAQDLRIQPKLKAGVPAMNLERIRLLPVP
jgi:alpha-L-fucosidase